MGGEIIKLNTGVNIKPFQDDISMIQTNRNDEPIRLVIFDTKMCHTHTSLSTHIRSQNHREKRRCRCNREDYIEEQAAFDAT